MKHTKRALLCAIYPIFSLLNFSAMPSSSISYSSTVPAEYHSALDRAIEKAGANAPELHKALRVVPENEAEGMAFLIANMPERDLTTLSADFLLENVSYAYKARERFEWSRAIPKELFLNDVLPYCVMNEVRDRWRGDFYRRFAPYVEQAKDIFEAITEINRHIRDELLVDYNTKREKPDQSPYESIRQGMASCSGLAILLTDAFRSVGIPSRIAGTPNWYDKRGNHSWNEVWADGQWYFTEYYPLGLNKSWFLSSAGKADPHSAEHAIYATSFKPTGLSFPLVWDMSITYVPAENVTTRYIERYRQELAEKLEGDYILVKVTFIDEKIAETDKRLAINVDVFDVDGQVDGGRTADGTKDLHDLLTFTLKKHHDYRLKYFLPDGTVGEYNLRTAGEALTVELPDPRTGSGR